MASFNTTLGYTTQNNEWEILTDKELAKHDLLMVLYTRKGECDWDPNFGTTIQDQIFQLKDSEVKNTIIDELKQIIDNSPFVALQDITTEELEKGWIFNLVISYMGEVPEEWKIPITEETVKEFKSTGQFPLIEEQ